MSATRPLSPVPSRDLVEDTYGLTPLQAGMLFHSLDAPNSGTYLNQQSYTLRGHLDVAAFRGAFERVVSRHQVLRTAFGWDASREPRQIVHRVADLPWEEHDWRGLSSDEQERRLADVRRSSRRQDFDLSRAPLMRLTLIRRGADLYEFMWGYHLMILDGWSVAVILGEVVAMYEASVRGGRVDLREPTPFRQYIDWLQRQDRSLAEQHWRRMLQGFGTPTPLGEDRSTGNLPLGEETYRETELTLEESESRALQRFARTHRVTPNTVVQGTWALHLARRSGLDDVVFGSVVAGRPVELPGIDTMVGLFINTLPVRVRIVAEMPVDEGLKALQAQQAAARQYEYMPLIDLQRWTNVPMGVLMFRSVLIFQNYPLKVSLSDGARSLTMLGGSSVERNSYPLTVVIEPGPRLLMRFVSDRRRFDEGTVERMIEQFRRLLVNVCADAAQTLGGVSSGSVGERARLIGSFNQSLA
jgi:hypothetical protein